MKTKILGLLAVGLLGVSAPASAVMVTVDGQTLDITTRTGTSPVLLDLLNDQIWWGDITKTVAWADALGGQLGYPNSTGSYSYSPFFAFSVDTFTGSDSSGTERNLGGPYYETQSFTFAVVESAAPVPLPAAAWLLLSGLAGLGFVGRRRKAA